MELQREPPPYQSHDPADVVLPSVPQSELLVAHSPSSDITLPDLRSILGDLPAKTVHPNILLSAAAAHQSQNLHSHDASLSNGNRTLPRPDFSPRTGATRTSIESMFSPSDTASVMSIEEQSQRSTSVSLEDPDVRLAAEALSGLGKSGYGRQSNSHSVVQNTPPAAESTSQTEPLLCLLPGRHPWVGSTISGSLSAYNVTKNYSPGFVRYGADLIERNIGTPLASTVSSVARRTGVENGLRRYLSSGRTNQSDRTDSADYPSHAETSADVSNKRRRVMAEPFDDGMMLDSVEDLPPYRTSKPPSYREEVSPHSEDRRAEQSQIKRTQSPAMTMAGLYVAMSDASLRSLRYCVKLLVNATEHVETVMRALKKVLQDMDRERDSRSQLSNAQLKKNEAGVLVFGPSDREQRDAAGVLALRIQQYCDDIMNTLKTVVNTVSTYAGGALPENARDYIKQQLLSVPQRWRYATQSTASSASQESKADGGEAGEMEGPDGEARRSARRMIAFATEGIDMMQAVNTVIQNTCSEAERWMDTLPAFRRNKDTEMMDADDR